MTKETSAEIRAELRALSDSLNTARADAALYERIKVAAGNIDRLTKQCEIATDKLATVLEAEKKAERAAANAPYRGMTITEEKAGGNSAGGLLSTRFFIRYTIPVFNHAIGQNEPMPVVHDGFDQLPGPGWDYLFAEKPELIPLSILELSPDNPREAFERYFVAKRRGYLVGLPMAAAN